MPLDVIVGGQGGDEGKGKIAAYLALNKDYSICMRVPSPQAGHSIYINGKRVGLAMIPTAVVNPKMRLLIGTGGLISLDKLTCGYMKEYRDGIERFVEGELKATGVNEEKLGIDYKATIVTKEHREQENKSKYLMGKVGSVGEGIAPCRLEKIMRKPELKFAKDIPELEKFLTDTKREIYISLEIGKNILLEGDHGAKLDLIHGEYPYVTSRATNSAGFMSEAGIGPKDVRDIYVVLKPYTTRVAPGPLESEILDERVLKWAHEEGGETGTVSKRFRRIGKFEWNNVLEVIKMNSATKIAITHLDCPDFVWKALGLKNDKEFLSKFKEKVCKIWPYPKLSLLSYGPDEKDTLELGE
jgi:adenylosuccinate synthase